MKYPSIEAVAPSTRRVATLFALALIVFTLASAITGSSRAYAEIKTASDAPYSVRMLSSKSGDRISLVTRVTDNKSHEVIAQPEIPVDATRQALAKTSHVTKNGDEIETNVEATPSGERDIAVFVSIRQNGKIIQQNRFIVVPQDVSPAKAPSTYRGDPITLDLRDADLRDVINTFGKLTGLEITIDDGIGGKVDVHWQNVPWDEAFDSLLKENGLTYRLEGKTMHVSRK